MSDFFITHICGAMILFVVVMIVYFAYCGIGHLILKLINRK